MSSGRCRNFVVSSRKPSPRIRRKIEVLPTSLLPLKATLYTGNVLFTPSAILPIFPTENHQHISEETMAMKVLWLTPSIRHIERKYANISSSPWSRACEAARPQSCSSSWTEKAYQKLGYFLLPTAMCIFTSDLLFGGLPCGLWKFIAGITRVIEYMQSCFCSRYAFLSAFYIGLFDRNLASKPILCTYLSAVKSLLPCVV